MWDVSGAIPDDSQRAIISHLEDNCRFRVEGPYQLRAEPLPFYSDALLCQLLLESGSCVTIGRRRKQRIETKSSFNFLFRTIAGDEVLIPLTGEHGDILLANRWLGLNLQDDRQRLDYARFYYAFARAERPPSFHNVPRELSELRFTTPVTEQRIWGLYGAMWRFLVDATALEVRVHFEPRGIFWRARHRAHVPMQIGSDIFDVDLKIWNLDGHISYRKTELIYRDSALVAEPHERPGRIRLPRYVRWGERWLTLYRNLKTSINQAVYLASTTVFLLASLLGLFFPLPVWGQSALRPLLELAAGAFQLIMGLLVIRRVHRFWASTAASRLSS